MLRQRNNPARGASCAGRLPLQPRSPSRAQVTKENQKARPSREHGGSPFLGSQDSSQKVQSHHKGWPAQRFNLPWAGGQQRTAREVSRMSASVHGVSLFSLPFRSLSASDLEEVWLLGSEMTTFSVSTCHLSPDGGFSLRNSCFHPKAQTTVSTPSPTHHFLCRDNPLPSLHLLSRRLGGQPPRSLLPSRPPGPGSLLPRPRSYIIASVLTRTASRAPCFITVTSVPHYPTALNDLRVKTKCNASVGHSD